MHMEGPSPAPETLRGVGTCSVSDRGFDFRRRPKGASHSCAYGLDDMLPDSIVRQRYFMTYFTRVYCG